MANHASAEKRNRQRITRTARNRASVSGVRTALRKARAALAASDRTSREAVQAAIQALARAASKGTIHPKAAARKTARLSAQLHRAAKA